MVILHETAQKREAIVIASVTRAAKLDISPVIAQKLAKNKRKAPLVVVVVIVAVTVEAIAAPVTGVVKQITLPEIVPTAAAATGKQVCVATTATTWAILPRIVLWKHVSVSARTGSPRRLKCMC